jgi:DNA recombination protein RmuC
MLCRPQSNRADATRHDNVWIAEIRPRRDSCSLSIFLQRPCLGPLLLHYWSGLCFRRTTPSGAESSISAERLQQLETEATRLKGDKANLELRLAVEEQKASRLPEMERAIAERIKLAETLGEGKGTAERQLAVSSEALTRVEMALKEAKARLVTTEEALEILRSEKAGLEEALAGRTEAVYRLEIFVEDLRGRLGASEQTREQTVTRLEIANTEKGDLQSEIARTTAVIIEKSTAADKLSAQPSHATEALIAVQKEVGDLRSRLASVDETLEQERKQAGEKLALLTEARERMTQEFKILANDVMKLHGETFSQQNKEQVNSILGPLREKLAEFQQGLQTSHAESIKERATLAEQIRQLSENSEKMTMEASSLVRALRGEAQTQGAWGEMILASILERSGLREGEEYVTQQSHETEDGQRLRPDVIVNLPGGHRIVIDSKVSLTAFDAHVNAGSDTERVTELTHHVASIRTHIKTLSRKEYHTTTDSQLDYVVMFIPIEGALAAALQAEPNLTAFAVENNVAIATPTTLMIALRTVDNVWQVERRNRNAENIAGRAGKIYDKLVAFIEDMQSLGMRLNQARLGYDQAMGKLSSGRGNLVQQVDQLKSLGAKASKSLPANMLDTGESESLLMSEMASTLAFAQQD